MVLSKPFLPLAHHYLKYKVEPDDTFCDLGLSQGGNII